MKILITTEFYLPFLCGITTAVLNMQKILTQMGHDVRVLTIADGKQSSYHDKVYYIRQNIPQLYKDSFATLAFNDPLLEEIYKWNPDIVHAQNEFFTFIFAKKIAKQCKTPLLLTCHTDYPAYGVHFMKSDKVFNTLVKTYVPKLIRKANALLCSSSKIRDLMISYEIKQPILDIKLGLDLSGFRQQLTEKEKEEMRKAIKLKECFTFVSICRLSIEKAVDKCISAFKKIHENCENTQFLIVGDGDEMDNLKKQAIDLGLQDSIIFAGEQPSENIWKFYKLGDVFISASTSETQGLTYIESIASGVPVICKNDEVNQSFLLPGINGYAYEDEETMLRYCIELINNPEHLEYLKKNSPDSVDSFSLEHFGNNLSELYEIAKEENWIPGSTIPAASKALKLFKGSV